MLAVAALALLALAPMQDPPAAPPGPPRPVASDSLLRVFVDCPNYVPGCDFDFLRTEVAWIDYVRDRETADIHALATTLTTGGGGTEYTIALIGRGPWAGRVDTLRFSTPGTAVQDEQRRAFARNLSLGLVRYAMATSAAPRLSLAYRAPEGGARTLPRVRDPWNSWVFELSYRGFAFGEQYYRDGNGNGEIEANRVTERWKLSFEGSYGESNSRFIYEYDSTDAVGNPVLDLFGNPIVVADTERTFNKDYGFEGSAVRSLGAHWSTRLIGEWRRSTRENIQRQIDVNQAIEYNVFPYTQSTRRQLTFQLAAGARNYVYDDTTIYDKLRETRPTARAAVSLNVTQPWGNASAGARHHLFLDNTHQNNTSFFGYFEVRVFKGFSVNFYGERSNVRDQLYLPKGGATRDDVLLRRRAIETAYFYYFNFGVSYRFGSTNNNVVNPRFNN